MPDTRHYTTRARDDAQDMTTEQLAAELKAARRMKDENDTRTLLWWHELEAEHLARLTGQYLG